jgi:hypothetical protein
LRLRLRKIFNEKYVFFAVPFIFFCSLWLVDSARYSLFSVFSRLGTDRERTLGFLLNCDFKFAAQ